MALRASIIGMALGACASPGAQDSAGPTTAREVPVRVESRAPSPCPDSADSLSAGRFVPLDLGPDWDRQPAGVEGQNAGWGVVADDFNGDGLVDLFLPHYGQSQLFVGRPDGAWEDASGGLPPHDLSAHAAVAGDLDADGDLDLVVGNVGPNAVWLNDGGGRFVEVARPFGGVAGRTHSLSLGDLDGDGVLDLAVANALWNSEESAPQELHLGLGDGSFAPAAWDPGPTAANHVGLLHLDEDDHLDLFLITDKPQNGFVTQAWRGDGRGGLTLVDPGLGLAVPVEGMGLGVGDLNDDEVDDFVVSDWGEIKLLLSSDGWWAEAAESRGLVIDETRVVSWAPELADLDLDGDLDLLVAFGPDSDFETGEPAAGPLDNPLVQDWGYYRNDGGVFTEVSAERGLFEAGNRRGFVLTDLTGDGHLDLVSRQLERAATAHMGVCTDRTWLTVSLRWEGSPNPRALGARVEVEAGRTVHRRQVLSGAVGIASSAPPVVHVGLGEAAAVDAVRIRWPDGALSTVSSVPASQHLVVVREAQR